MGVHDAVRTASPSSWNKGEPMAELTHLDEKLAEVLGLAQAAQVATRRSRRSRARRRKPSWWR